MNSEPLKLALALLTRLPVSVHTPVQPRNQGLAVPCYPLVGLLIGALLATLAAALHSAPAWPLAALLVIAWVGLTGALHLDGLADSADAWLGGYGDRQRTLQIMKDPACGPAGVVALVLVLLGKVAALATLLASGQWLSLLLAPVLGRSACAALFVILPYQRDNGLAGDAARHLPRRATLLAGLTGLLLALVCGQLLMAMVSVLLLAGGAALMRQRLGGFTGDTAGALVEGVEMASLLAAALLL